jgi:hypothetical protein
MLEPACIAAVPALLLERGLEQHHAPFPHLVPPRIIVGYRIVDLDANIMAIVAEAWEGVVLYNESFWWSNSRIDRSSKC